MSYFKILYGETEKIAINLSHRNWTPNRKSNPESPPYNGVSYICIDNSKALKFKQVAAAVPAWIDRS